MPDHAAPEVERAPWLEADELAAWRGFIQMSQRLPAALGEQLQADSRLSFLEYYVLALLSEAPVRTLRLHELATRVNAERSRLSHLVKRLEIRGLVRRRPDPEDARFHQAILTEDGYAYLSTAAPAHVARVRDLFIEALEPEELRTLLRCAGKIAARIDRLPGRPAGP